MLISAADGFSHYEFYSIAGGAAGTLIDSVTFHHPIFCCEGRRGNVDLLGVSPNEVDMSDLGLLVDFLFSAPGTIELPCEREADMDGSGGDAPIDLTDLGMIVEFLFSEPGTVFLNLCD
jgi:hypothetical protein